MMRTAADYLHKYSSFIYRSSPVALPPLTADDLYAIILACSQSAPGMDAWTYEDHKILPVVAFQHL
eukprot:6559580-Karenia_brevis.AAC.1